MTRAIIVLALVTTMVAGVGGYWADRDGIPVPHFTYPALGAPAKPEPANGPILYFRDPDGKASYSDTPKKTPDGRDYIAVRAGEDVSFDKPKPAETPRGGKEAPKRLRFYRNPMGLPDTSPSPKKDSMGMDYIPVYEGEDEDGSTVKITPGKLQRTGVRSEPAIMRVLTTPIRAPGVVAPDEHRQTVVALRFDAFIEKLEHVTTGSAVRKGEPLMRLYSSTLSAAAAQYVTDLGIRDTSGLSSTKGARRRLENLGVPETIIQEIERTKEGALTVTWPAPRDGFITEHNVVEGMRAQMGEVLFRIADISVVWVLADVAERDLSLIATGQAAMVKPRGYPGRTFTGKISLVYPAINKETRTARVRIELANPQNLLMPNMYADVELATGSEQPVLAVPDDAVIDSGARKVVIIDKGDGRFEPREVTLGRRGGGYTEIRNGVAANDRIVVAANFLIDAESNLKAALQGLATPGDAK